MTGCTATKKTEAERSRAGIAVSLKSSRRKAAIAMSAQVTIDRNPCERLRVDQGVPHHRAYRTEGDDDLLTGAEQGCQSTFTRCRHGAASHNPALE